MKKAKLFLSSLLSVFCILLATNLFGQTDTATYTVYSTTIVTPSGTAPGGSSATYSQTYTTAKQITGGNSATLTLSGYAGKKITGIILNMKSNSGSGAGSLDMAAGTGTYPTGYTTIYFITGSGFNTANWFGSWSSSYVNIAKSITPYTVLTGEKIVIRINASANSLYIQSFSIIYEDAVLTAPILSNESFSGVVSSSFSKTPANTGGLASSWSIVSGALPSGLSLNTTTGEISGTPSVTGTYIVDIQASNAAGNDTKTYTITISSGPCYTSNGPNGSASGSTFAGDTDPGGLPTSTIRLASGSSGGSVSFSTTGIAAGDIKLRFRAEGWSTTETEVTVTVDGQDVNYTTLPTTAFGWVEITFTGVAANPSIEFSTVKNKRVHIGNIEVICIPPTPSCTPAITLTQIRPATASIDSRVQVEINDATLVSQVSLGGSTIPFTVVNATTIEFVIPAGASSGVNTLKLIETSLCETVSSIDVTTDMGFCSDLPATYNDLFISEIYDSQSDNQWYMELFNPTGNPIVLDNVYQIKRSGNISPLSYTRTIGLTGTVPPYSVYTLFIGDALPVTCTGITFDFTETGDGINESDQIDLFKNGVQVDVAQAPNEKGYTLKRKKITGETVPTTSYSATQWDINSSESCSDLGVFNVTLTTVNLTNPVDVSGCKVDMSVSSSTPGVTYKWFYNHPETMTNWLEVNTTNLPSVTLSGETTDHLIISGNTIGLDGYQFYCVASSGSCGKISNAAEFTYSNMPIYRSVVTTGNWSNPASWEIANAVAGPWTAACTYPTAANSTKVFIEPSTTITLDINNDVDYLEIKNGGTLEIIPSAQLTLNNDNAGVDFVVDGTFNYRSNSVHSFAFGTGATWSLGASATFIKTNTGGLASFRDNYEGGISTIPTSAQWIYRYNGDGNPTTVSINMYYPNLRFENITVTPFTTDSFSSFTGNTSTVIIKGNLEVGTTGSSTYKLLNNNYHANPLLVMGDFSIGNGSELTNDKIASTNEGTGVELKGNLIVNGTLNLIAGTTERILKFTGTGNQTVSGTGSINVYKIETNKASGDLLLSRNLQAQNELTMINGHIYTNANILELGLNTSQKGILSYTNGYVIGKMKRWFNGTNSGNSSGLFPMGFNDSGLKNRFAKIEYTTAPTSGGDLTVEFIGSDMTYNGLVISAANSGGFGSNITNAEDQGFWTCSAGTLSGGVYTSSFTGEGFSQIVSLLDITLLKRANSSVPWTAPGVHIPATGTTSLPIVSRSNLSGFSDFGFGSRNSANPLPVELTTFVVECADQVSVKWTTASEKNNDKFVLEKSNNMMDWQLVKELKGQGNSSHAHSYQVADRKDFNVVYYRLTQIDFDGKQTIYQPISSICQGEITKIFEAYPNPVADELTVEISGYSLNNGASVSLYETSGRLVSEIKLITTTGHSEVIFNVSQLASGMYYIQLQNEGKQVTTKKVIVK